MLLIKQCLLFEFSLGLKLVDGLLGKKFAISLWSGKLGFDFCGCEEFLKK